MVCQQLNTFKQKEGKRTKIGFMKSNEMHQNWGFCQPR